MTHRLPPISVIDWLGFSRWAGKSERAIKMNNF
jgi:hypothetical protein